MLKHALVDSQKIMSDSQRTKLADAVIHSKSDAARDRKGPCEMHQI